MAMKLSISVVTSSSTSSLARRGPGATSHAPPTIEAPARATGTSSALGQSVRL
jgi:hypothetical protein